MVLFARSALLTLPLLCAACGNGGVSNESDAALAYLGLDGMVSKAMGLGFDGYNTASSANIDEQLAEGDLSGTLTVAGQVDQGSSDNKGMRLTAALDEYADDILEDDDNNEVSVTYWTDEAALPELDLQLRNVPDGTVQGSLVGAFSMEGDLEGDVVLSLDFIGEIEDGGGGEVVRSEGTLVVTGSATSPYGVYTVDLTL